MEYQVELQDLNSFNVSINLEPNTINANLSGGLGGGDSVANLEDITNINTNNLNVNANNYVLVYDPSTQGYKFIAPSTLLGLSDGDTDSTTLDYGNY